MGSANYGLPTATLHASPEFMCEIHLRRNANQRPNSWEYEKTPFFRRINKKLLSHHEAYEGGSNPSKAWINGSLQLRVVAHEMGHNLGLYHSHSMSCGSAVIGNPCTSSDYGDSFDTMGSSSY